MTSYPSLPPCFVIASEARQSMTSEGMDRHGLRPRDDANNTVIARSVSDVAIHVRYRPGFGGLAMTVRARLTMTG